MKRPTTHVVLRTEQDPHELFSTLQGRGQLLSKCPQVPPLRRQAGLEQKPGAPALREVNGMFSHIWKKLQIIRKKHLLAIMTSGWLTITPEPRPHTTWALSTPPPSSPYCLSCRDAALLLLLQLSHGFSLAVPPTTIPLPQLFSWLTPSLRLGAFSNVTAAGMPFLSILSNPFPHLSNPTPLPAFHSLTLL